MASKTVFSGFSGFEDEIDSLFIRYFRDTENKSKILLQGNPIPVYFYNEYLALRRDTNQFPSFPVIVITPHLPVLAEDYPVYSANFVYEEKVSDTDSVLYSFEACTWKSFNYEVKCITTDYALHRRLITLLNHKIFPRINSKMYIKLSENDYRLIEIVDPSDIESDEDSTFSSSVTYKFTVPVFERDPIVVGNIKTVNVQVNKTQARILNK